MACPNETPQQTRYTMRLTTEQINTIVTTCRTFAGDGALVWLYGSRLDDTRHGGDIDLLIEPQESVNLLLRARIKTRLEQTLSLPVDVMVKNPGTPENPFLSIARTQAKLLEITT
ncbi:MAG: nucleotidyltransferase domain-containing protein [Chlorobiaceae bacterium]